MNILSQYLFPPKIKISSGAGIMDDGARETEISCCPGRCVNAHMAHGTTDHHIFNSGVFKPIQKRRLTKTVRKVFFYHRFI